MNNCKNDFFFFIFKNLKTDIIFLQQFKDSHSPQLNNPFRKKLFSFQKIESN